MVLWHVRVAGGLSPLAALLYLALIAIWAGFGYALARWLAPSVGVELGAPQQLVMGFFCANTAGFILALLLPFGILWQALATAALAAAAAWAAARRPALGHGADFSWPGLFACLASAVAATWWCGDVQPPFATAGEVQILQTWQDVFIHARILSGFVQGHGIASLQDLRLAGVASPPYHYASYITPASIAALADLRPLQVYASFQLPFGIYLTGLAAYILFTPMFGRWPALAGCIAVVALPDAFLQGFGNRYLSYFFLSQINLGMLYGIAAAALAWFFVLHGARQGKLGLVMVGYGWLAVCLLYKAHLFVANAYPLIVFPCLFMTHYGRAARLAAWSMLTALFVLTVWYSQRVTSIPLIKLDFSAAGVYTAILLDTFDPGWWSDLLHRFFVEQAHGRLVQGLVLLGVLALFTLGAWTPVLAALLWIGRVRVPAPILLFPVLVVVNYLIMASGLAQDAHGVGTVDELQNRPLVWAYFIVAAWCAACACYLWRHGRPPLAPRTRMALSLVAAALCMWPLQLGNNLQTFPARGMARYQDFNAVPVCLARTADFVRLHSRPDELVQEGEGDRRFMLSALSERQSYVASGAFSRQNAEIADRMRSLTDAMAGSAERMAAFGRQSGIGWLVVEGSQAGPWSAAWNPAFSCGTYRAYHLAALAAAPKPAP